MNLNKTIMPMNGTHKQYVKYFVVHLSSAML